MLERLKAVLANIGLELNAEKTRIITTASEANIAYIDVNGDMVQALTDIETHMYLGRKIPADLRRCSVVEVAYRINAAWGKFNKFRTRSKMKNRHTHRGYLAKAVNQGHPCCVGNSVVGKGWPDIKGYGFGLEFLWLSTQFGGDSAKEEELSPEESPIWQQAAPSWFAKSGRAVSAHLADGTQAWCLDYFFKVPSPSPFQPIDGCIGRVGDGKGESAAITQAKAFRTSNLPKVKVAREWQRKRSATPALTGQAELLANFQERVVEEYAAHSQATKQGIRASMLDSEFRSSLTQRQLVLIPTGDQAAKDKHDKAVSAPLAGLSSLTQRQLVLIPTGDQAAKDKHDKAVSAPLAGLKQWLHVFLSSLQNSIHSQVELDATTACADSDRPEVRCGVCGTAVERKGLGLRHAVGDRVWCSGYGPRWPAKVDMISFDGAEDREPYCVSFYGENTKAKLMFWGSIKPSRPAKRWQRRFDVAVAAAEGPGK
ncbi:hypothetical protein AK812_SmicGene31395 [Symbiodinium microadriaticum]|uniref:Uncharacterized protein n=1 Tax=Symbiodinium microadriaticum TaxID=2951 RepID=A0A1Q9CWV3_SYMMI|nr:hypothetical protein AK812_SmicGene31395 [Symbiodinium microadriaticum]